VPLILTYDARGNGDGKTVNTITGDHNNRVTDYTCVVCEPVVYNGENITSPTNKANPKEGDPCHTLGTDSRNYLVYCLQGNGIERSDTAGCCGKGWAENTSYTLNTMDRHAVAYGVTLGFKAESTSLVKEKSSALVNGTRPGHCNGVCYCVGNGQADQTKLSEKVGALNCMHDQQCVLHTYNQQAYDEYIETDKGCTLKASGGSYGGGSENIVVEPQYIVRRLCPVECARLQGFPDTWGHPDKKDDFTDEEYAFWLKVRNDWATINGKKVKEYTKEQMLKWYNSLHTDSAEYEMWGNGICLQNALYVMEGIAEVLRRRKWTD
jgi:DNA (cytosine-5)-methyltransferase 1